PPTALVVLPNKPPLSRQQYVAFHQSLLYNVPRYIHLCRYAPRLRGGSRISKINLFKGRDNHDFATKNS
ncbi:MAG: hypothetical protein RSB53_07210, partial [Oscillospiraceae bacterium]